MTHELTTHVWDPNGVNPYGQEVYALLATKRGHTCLWMPSSAEPVIDLSPDVKAILAGSIEDDGPIQHLLRRLISPLALAAKAIVHHDRVILTWTRGNYENFIFGTLARIRPVSVVHHNPTAERSVGGIQGFSFRYLLRGAKQVLVHSSLLMEEIPEILRCKVSIVRHPPYESWASRHSSFQVGERDSKTTLLFLGALRTDKGVGHLAELAHHLDPERFRLLIAGTGVISDTIAARFRESPLEVELRVNTIPLTQEEIARALADANVLLAPYIGATVSGTVIMANSVGLPVLGYNAGALREYLCAAALTCSPTPEALALKIDDWNTKAFETHQISSMGARGEFLETWGRALALL
jgi:glycosyltransferase involved in cell wall biosynthesis